MSEQRRFGDRYALLEVLGEGPSGRVWAARGIDGSWVAVKVFDDPARKVEAAWVRRMARLRHPRLVGVRDAVTEAGRLGVVTELVEGGDLRRTLRTRGTIEPAAVCRWGAQIADGLAALHAEGVVHGGVRLGNVLLECGTDEVRLVDAGVATVVDTPRQHGPGAARDLDDLGALLFELCCGVGPFHGREPARSTTGAVWLPGRPDGMPGPLWELISSLMDPERRPASAAEAARQLQALAPSMAGIPAADPIAAAPAPTLRVLTSASATGSTRTDRAGRPEGSQRCAGGRVRRRTVALVAAGAVVAGSAIGLGAAAVYRAESVTAPPTVEVRPAVP